jgi:hypothetical protein
MVKNTFITIFIFVVLVFLSPRILACSCGGQSVEGAFDSSYAAFTGKVIKIEVIKIQNPTNSVIDAKTQKIRILDKVQLSETELQKVTFEVIENFKEVRNDFTRGHSKTIDVLTEVIKDGNCGIRFREGESFLVFGGKREPYLSKEDSKLAQEQRTEEMILQSQADKLNENLPIYVTSICSRTNLLKFAKEDVGKVRFLSRIGLPR